MVSKDSLVITKSILLISVLLLSACKTPQTVLLDASNKCPQIGIDVNAPDFFQHHKPKEVEQFYSCMERELKPRDITPIGKPSSLANNMYNHVEIVKSSLQPALQYQRNLWRQVFAKEKAPGAAYEAWVRWQQTERNMATSQQAADDAARAAWGVNNAAQQQQFQSNFQLQQQNMQMQQIQQQQLINNSMSGR